VTLPAHALLVAGAHVHAHRLDLRGALLAELGEEAVQGGGVAAFRAPDHPPAVVGGDQRQVSLTLPPGHFVDADDEQPVQPVRVEHVTQQPGDDAPNGR
jgi:hypothetical protein